MQIEEKLLLRWINNFYGYGSWHAQHWFVGFEEGGGDLPEEVAERLQYFEQKHKSVSGPTLCDIRELYKQVSVQLSGPRAGLFNNLHDYRFGKAAVQHTIWKNLTSFLHGYRQKKMPDLLNYQKNTFAKNSGHEAWIQLYPLPSPHNHAWYYSWLHMPGMKFLKSRETYQQQVYQSRVAGILESIALHKPEVVLWYGMNNIATLKESVIQYFPEAKFKSMKAEPRVIPQHHYAEIHGTQLVITTQIPALRHNRIETGFDWQHFGETVKGYAVDRKPGK